MTVKELIEKLKTCDPNWYIQLEKKDMFISNKYIEVVLPYPNELSHFKPIQIVTLKQK